MDAAELFNSGLVPCYALLELRMVSPERPLSIDRLTGLASIPGGESTLQAVYYFPIPPTDTRSELIPPVIVTRTAGGSVRDHAPDLVRRVGFAGEVGLAIRLGTDAQGQLRYLPSRVLFEELWKFISNYLNLSASASNGWRYELVLRWFDRDWHWVAEPQAPFFAVQDRMHRHTFRYEMTFECVRPVKAPRATGALADFLRDAGTVMDAVNMAVEKIALATVLATQVPASLSRVTDAVRQPLVTLASLAPSLLAAVEGVDAVRNFPASAARQLSALASSIQSSVDEVLGTLSSVHREEAGRDLVDFRLAVHDIEQSGWIAEAALRQQNDYQYRSYLTHELQAGETLQQVARRRLGDESRWTEVAEMNHLRPPWTSPGGLPGTAAPGDTIRLPADAGAGSGGLAGGSAGGPDDEQLYGVDLMLADGQDYVAVAVSGPDLDDLAWVRGTANIEAALLRRCTTVRGRNGVFPLLGIEDLVGRSSRQSGAWTLASVTEQVYRDDRVQAVQDASLDPTGDRTLVEFTAVLVDGRKMPLSAGT